MSGLAARVWRRAGRALLFVAWVGVASALGLELVVRVFLPQQLTLDAPGLWTPDPAIGWRRTPDARMTVQREGRDLCEYAASRAGLGMLERREPFAGRGLHLVDRGQEAVDERPSRGEEVSVIPVLLEDMVLDPEARYATPRWTAEPLAVST